MYALRTPDGKHLRRHVDQIRPALNQNAEHQPRLPVDENETSVTNEDSAGENIIAETEAAKKDNETSEPDGESQRRIRKPPSYWKDYAFP